MVKSASSRSRNAGQSRPPAREAARAGDDSRSHDKDTVLDQAPASDEIVVRDVRRRGWFWHWNTSVTQAGALLTPTGVGILMTYVAMTDHRPNSPWHGYAYPSIETLAAFYGIDRGRIIVINKILETLDLIEVRKELVSRPSEDGKNYRTIVNLYLIKDRADGYDLTAEDVRKVVNLANESEAYYRHIRHVLSERFTPLDPEGVWKQILPVVRRDPIWQKLAAKVAEDEERASARSRKGHTNRKDDVDASSDVDGMAAPADEKDSVSVISTGDAQTNVAPSNTGVTTGVAPSNSGFKPPEPTSVAPGNDAPPTSVEQSNMTYHVLKASTTTTTSSDRVDEPSNVSWLPVTPSETGVNAPVSPVERAAPGDGPAMERAIRNFEEANDNRRATAAERRRLAELADQFDAEAKRQAPGSSGWRWVAEAIDDSVDSGSTYMAPRRIETILTRWAEEGAPERASGGVVRLVEFAAPVRAAAPEPEMAPERESASAPVPEPPMVPFSEPIAAEPFWIDECGMLSTQFWHVVLDDLVAGGKLSRSECDAWLRPARIVGRGERGELILLAPNTATRKRLERREVNADVRAACALILGRDPGLIIHAAPTGSGPAGLPGVSDLPARAD